jgi:hypothetical protein
MEEGTSMQAHIDKVQMILMTLPLSFHTLVVSLNTRTNQLSMELICGQLLQKEL